MRRPAGVLRRGRGALPGTTWSLRRRLCTGAVVAGAVAMLSGLVVHAFLDATTHSTLGISAGHVNAEGALSTPTVAGRDVTLAWPSDTVSDGTPTTYYVLRDGVAAGGTCYGLLPASTLSCTDVGVAPGAHTWSVVPDYQSWVGASASAGATVGSPTLTLPSTTSNLPQTLSGSVANFLDGESVTFRLDDATTGTVLTGTVNSVATPSAVPTGGSASVTVTIPLGTPGGSHTVYAVGDGGSQASAGVTVTASLTVPGGQSLTTGQTITATLTGFQANDTITLSLDSASGTPVTSPASVVTGASSGNATATITVPDGATAGGHAVYASGSLGDHATSANTFTVLPSASVPPSSSVPVGGSVTATLSGFAAADTITLKLDSSSGVTVGTATTGAAAGNATKVVTIPAATSLGLHALFASDGTRSATSNTFTVTASSLDHFVVTAPTSATAGSAFSVTVTAKDASNNTIVGFSGTVHFTSSDPHPASLPADYTFTSADAGVHTFAGAVTLFIGPSQTVTVNDVTLTTKTGSTSVAVNGGAASRLTVSSGTSLTAGTAFPVTVTALDAYGNRATAYTGTVSFSLGVADVSATGLGNYTFTTSGGTPDNGRHIFSVTLTKAVASGGQSITATDTVTSTITGSQTSITVAPGSASKLAFVQQPGDDAGTGAFSPQPQVAVEDAFGNVVTSDNTTTITLARNAGSGTLHCYANGSQSSALTMTVSAGVAVFSGCALDQAGTNDTLKATSNPAHGTVVSTAFAVSISAPTITFPTASNQETITGGSTVTFTVVGTNFASGARVSIAASSMFKNTSWTWVDSTHLSVTTTAKNNTGTTDITVTNPDGGTVTSTGSLVNS